MTTFDEVPRIERIALIARAMEIYAFEAVSKLWLDHSYRPVEYNPYTNASQSQDVQARIGISTELMPNHMWIATQDRIDFTKAPALRDAIADCAARWQWEKERAGK